MSVCPFWWWWETLPWELYWWCVTQGGIVFALDLPEMLTWVWCQGLRGALWEWDQMECTWPGYWSAPLAFQLFCSGHQWDLPTLYLPAPTLFFIPLPLPFSLFHTCLCFCPYFSLSLFHLSLNIWVQTLYRCRSPYRTMPRMHFFLDRLFFSLISFCIVYFACALGYLRCQPHYNCFWHAIKQR